MTTIHPNSNWRMRNAPLAGHLWFLQNRHPVRCHRPRCWPRLWHWLRATASNSIKSWRQSICASFCLFQLSVLLTQCSASVSAATMKTKGKNKFLKNQLLKIIDPNCCCCCSAIFWVTSRSQRTKMCTAYILLIGTTAEQDMDLLARIVENSPTVRRKTNNKREETRVGFQKTDTPLWSIGCCAQHFHPVLGRTVGHLAL